MRRTIMAGNWKMNGTNTEATLLIEAIQAGLVKQPESVDVIICPPFTALERAMDLTEDTSIYIGAQNMEYREKGAFTGEISPAMLTELGVSHVIIGHSERRAYYNETDESINAKIKAALHNGLTPILCVGENLSEREAGTTIQRIEGQLRGALLGLSPEDVNRLVIAYEPIWAIGTGRTASADQAEDVCAEIRRYLGDAYQPDLAQEVSILYGGSVNSSNVKTLLREENIDGALVGGASLKADEFVSMIQDALEVG